MINCFHVLRLNAVITLHVLNLNSQLLIFSAILIDGVFALFLSLPLLFGLLVPYTVVLLKCVKIKTLTLC